MSKRDIAILEVRGDTGIFGVDYNLSIHDLAYAYTLTGPCGFRPKFAHRRIPNVFN